MDCCFGKGVECDWVNEYLVCSLRRNSIYFGS